LFVKANASSTSSCGGRVLSTCERIEQGSEGTSEMAEDEACVSKKTAKLSIDKQADSGRRLVEYFVVVSSLEQTLLEPASEADVSWKTESYDEEDEFAAYRFKPTITARYPIVDHNDNPLHDNVTLFCHPTGGIQLRVEPYMPKVRRG
jgi:hypothetical protein